MVELQRKLSKLHMRSNTDLIIYRPLMKIKKPPRFETIVEDVKDQQFKIIYPKVL